MNLIRTAGLVAVTLTSALAGATIGLACAPCDPDEPIPVEDGLWEIVSAGRDEIENGTVELSGDEVVISFERTDGTMIEVRYAVVDRAP